MKIITNTPEAINLRRKAEELLNKKRSIKTTQLSEAEIREFTQELEIHQIELKLQNEELTEQMATAQRYTELYDFAPLGYFTLSKDGEVLEINIHGSQMLGKERSRLMKSKFGFFVSNDTRPIYNLFLDTLFNSKIKESCEITLSTDENSPMHVYLSGISIDGERCFISMFDVTEQKKLRKEIIESQRLGAIGEMAASIAHDFNNSLQSISGNLELAMVNSEFSNTTPKYINLIKTAVSDISNRIKSLQQFGGNKQDKSPYFSVNLNILIDEVITQSSHLWKDEAQKRGLSITIKTEYGEIPNIYGNDGELRTVLYNIVKNSVEAMPSSGIISISTEKKTDGVYIDISDPGIGMDEKTSARIFQPFYSTKGFDTGRGLGMSEALSIIKEHGGQMYVKDTEPGKGTTIEIILPLLPYSQKEVIEKTKERVLSSESPVRILWVDDDKAIGDLVGEMIKVLHYAGDMANSGKIALEYLDRNAYDLVITDIGMPEMSGWQLADIIKEKFAGKMKVIVASGYFSQLSEDEKINHGVVGCLGKPFTISQLKKLLSELAIVKSKVEA